MKLRTRLVWTSLAVTIPICLALSVGLRQTRTGYLEAAILAVARTRAALPVDGASDLPVDVRLPNWTRRPGQVAMLLVRTTLVDPDDEQTSLSAAFVREARDIGFATRMHGETHQTLVSHHGVWVLAEVSDWRVPWGVPLPLVLVPVLLTILVAVLGMGPLVRRVRSASLSIERLGTGVSSALNEDLHNDELAVLINSFRAAALLLSRREEVLRQFVAHTAHDLGTPLTVLRGHLEAMVERPDGATLVKAQEEARYIGSLLANLSTRSKLELDECLRVPVDMTNLVSGVFRRFQSIASDQDSSFEATWPDNAMMVMGDPVLIERAVSNLVENSLRHGCEDRKGNIALLLAETSAGFTVTIMDDGPGMQEAEKVRLKQSVGQARSRNAHHGLGLQITTKVVTVHGWSMAMSTTEPSGLTVCISGPSVPSPAFVAKQMLGSDASEQG